jgi:hypothetical protein
MPESPISNIGPCNDHFAGRLMWDWCHDCHHVLSVHRQDRVCSVCDTIAALRVEMFERIAALEAKMR